jgi:VWFA-related protein
MRCRAGQTAYWMVLAAACAAARAQDAPHAPTITVSTHLVQISVIARGARGTPATGLTKADFVLRDQGRPRAISIFEVESEGAPAKAASTIAPGTFSNRGTASGFNADRSMQGNVTILLLDNLNTLSGSHPQTYEDTPTWVEDHAAAYGKQRLLTALNQMAPSDRIAIYALGGSLRLLCDFTCDREQQIAAVKAYDPRSKTLRETAEPGIYRFPDADPGFERAVNEGNQIQAAQQNGQRGRATLSSLGIIAKHVAAIPGRKSLLWLTADLPFSGEAAARILGPANIAVYPIDARGLMPQQVMTDSASGPRGVAPASATPPVGIEAMQEVAYETGGRAYVNTNGISEAIREVVEDTGARYTLGFYVDEASVDGKFHELKLQVNKAGVSLELPRGYFATKDPPPSDSVYSMLLAAIQSPFDATAIPLDIKAARMEKPRAHLLEFTGFIGIANLPMPAEDADHSALLEVRLVEQDAAGNVLRQAIHRMDLRLTEKQYRSYLETGVAFRQTLQPLASTTVVRVLVREPQSRQLGSVILPLREVK